MTKSPEMNSPVPSRKKHRSASPSHAMPMSAFSAMTRSVIAPVLLDERVRFEVGERPVHLEAQRRQLLGGDVREEQRRHHAGDAATCVEHDVERRDDRKIDE